jgi:hypothetical protein
LSGKSDFRLLGPVEARTGDTVAALGGPRQRGVLAILLLHANQVVPSERLIDLIWGESAPPTAATALQGYVSQLRKVIEPDRTAPSVIVTEGPATSRASRRTSSTCRGSSNSSRAGAPTSPRVGHGRRPTRSPRRSRSGAGRR